jgi:hypothetical protein
MSLQITSRNFIYLLYEDYNSFSLRNLIKINFPFLNICPKDKLLGLEA